MNQYELYFYKIDKKKRKMKRVFQNDADILCIEVGRKITGNNSITAKQICDDLRLSTEIKNLFIIGIVKDGIEYRLLYKEDAEEMMDKCNYNRSIAEIERIKFKKRAELRKKAEVRIAKRKAKKEAEEIE